MNHGKNVAEGNVDVLALLVGTESESRTSHERSEVVGILSSISSRPGDVFLVRNDRSGESGSVVPTPSDKHESARRIDQHCSRRADDENLPSLGDVSFSLEFELLLGGLDGEALAFSLDGGAVEGVLGEHGVVGVGEIGRIDGDGLGQSSFGGGVDGSGDSSIVVGESRSGRDGGVTSGGGSG